MRISTAYQYSNLETNVQLTAGRLYDAQQQVSTGRRLNKPSDDPAGLAKSLSLRTLRASIEGYDQNLQTAKGILGYTDESLSSMHDIANSAYQAALKGANSSTDQPARNALADQITQLQTRLVTVANSRGPSGQYLFAGQKDDTQPYTVGPSGIFYNGDNRQVVVPTDPTSTIVVSSPGEPMVSNFYTQLETLKNDLLGGNPGALSNVDVASMQAAQTQFSSLRGQVGSKLQTVADATTQNARRKDDLTGNISDIEEVDMSQAILGYQQAQNAYQAALTVAGQGFKMSLMDFIST